MLDWVQDNPALSAGLAMLSLLSFLGALALAPFLALRLPADYFSGRRRPRPKAGDGLPRLLRWPFKLLKNLLGLALLLMGTAMLVLPGQGLLTILAGLLFMDFPGKYRLELWLVSRRPVLRSINWLRRRRGVPILELDPRP